MDPALRLGLELPLPPGSGTGRWTAAAAAAEEAGFGGLWTDGVVDPCALAGGLVPATSSAFLGVVSGVGETDRNPSVLARDVTALDVLSGGRAAVLLVAGDGDRLAEAVRVCRLLFTEDRPDFTGRHFQLQGAANRPPPLRPGGPLVVAELPELPAGERRVPDAPVDGWVVGGAPEEVAAWRRVVDGPALLWRGELPVGPEVLGPASALIDAGADGLIVRGPGSAEAVRSTGRALAGRWAA